MNTVLSVLIAGHLISVEVLAGTLLFLSVVVKPAHAGVPELLLTRRVERLAFLCLGVAVVTMIGWLWLVAAASAGLRSLPTPEIVFQVLTTTPFGMVWGVRALAVTFAISALIRGHDRRSGRSEAPLAWSMMVLVSLTLASRVATGEHAVAAVALQFVHLIATSAWLGGMVMLGLMAWRTGANESGAWAKLPVPAGLAYRWFFASSVGVLMVSGLGLAWVMTGGHIVPQFYFDKVLAVKIALAVGAVTIGSLNRSVLMGRFMSNRTKAAPMLWTGLTIEAVLALAAIGAAAVLELTPLPGA